MNDMYGIKAVTIWINTPKEAVVARIEADPLRSGRQEDETVKDHFDIIFEPTNVLANDLVAFVDLIRKITLT